MWEQSFNAGSNDFEKNFDHQVQVAHILLCLANGKCGESSCVAGEGEQYSAGWSLYSASRDIFGDLLNSFHQCTDQILVLQTIVLMV
jgi:hypothetical protein